MWLRYRVMDLRGRGVYSHFADEFQCIFIHIPKTAGTSISYTLFNRDSRHIPYFEYEKANPRKFKRYFKFTFVRNPWDRLVSTFFFLKHGGLNETDRRWAERHLAEYNDFETFVRDWVTEGNVWSWVHFKPQHYFVCDDTLNLKVDFVGRVEHIETDLTTISERVNQFAKLPVLNQSEHRDYKDYYSNETRNIVSRVYGNDIATFGYQFDDG